MYYLVSHFCPHWHADIKPLVIANFWEIDTEATENVDPGVQKTIV